MSRMALRAILFDLDGTLYQSLPSSGKAFNDYIRSLGVDISDEDEIRAARWTHFYFANSFEIHTDEQAFPENGAFWTNFAQRRLVALGLSASEAAALAPRAAAYMAEHYKPIFFVPREVFPLLKKLQAAGYKMGVVSNRKKPFWEKLIDLNLSPYFEFALAGGEVHAYKPDSAIFERALERCGAAAEETLYVGDNYFADVVGARQLGIPSVLYDPEGLFHDFDCAAIRSFDELPAFLQA